ncbi:MAG: YdjY domain-containing protein [Verrucomicrobiota bacterium]|jgi:hypothetical protein
MGWKRGLMRGMAREHSQWSKLLPARALAAALTLACLVLRGQQPATNLPATNATPPARGDGAAFDPFERAMLPPDLSSPEVKSNMPIREISPGIFELGDVRIDKAQRTVSFPARLNLDQGPMEYFLVTSWGKTHESILKTDTEPFRIHLAMLLLDAKAGGPTTATNDPPVSVGGFVSHPSKVRLPGEAVSIELKWTVNGKETRKRAEEMIFNTEQNSVMRGGDWVYTGSRVIEGLFLAEIDGSVVSLVTDGEALINNEGTGHDNDTIWLANTNSLPPTNTPVTVSIKLNPPTGK